MTESNRIRNVADEVTRADQALRAAEALLSLGLHADAVSRAYYAAFHLVRALLLTRGVEPRSHQGAIHLLNVELVRPGQFPASHNRLLAGLQRQRENADYDAAVVFTAEDAQAAVEDARAFAVDARAALHRWGYRPPAT
jgi:uncharacterized protein (UPF0332 family)